jgi:hypothetical protein
LKYAQKISSFSTTHPTGAKMHSFGGGAAAGTCASSSSLDDGVPLLLLLPSSEVLSSSSESLSSPRGFEFAQRRFVLDARRRRTPPCDDAERAALANLAAAICSRLREAAAFVFCVAHDRRGAALRFEGVALLISSHK